MTRTDQGEVQHSQRTPEASSKPDLLLCRADRVKYPGRLMPDEASQCLLGPFWSARFVKKLKVEPKTKDKKVTSVNYSLFTKIFTVKMSVCAIRGDGE